MIFLSLLSPPSYYGSLIVKKLSRMTPARLNVEVLEDRLTPATFISVNSNLYIDGSNQADRVIAEKITIEGIDYYQVTENGQVTRFKTSQITGSYIYFFGNDGNDRFENYTDLYAVAYGGEGDDYLMSVSGGYLDGEGGNDVLIVGQGKEDNVLIGGEGNDTLTGSSGRDLIYGGPGNDVIYGGAGNDYIEGGEGDDVIYGGAGNDVIHGGEGDDKLYGEDGDDRLNGGPGSDWIWGGFGADICWGGEEDEAPNWIYGGPGNDLLIGGRGNDHLYGGVGNDRLLGGDGNDRLFGGPGQDYLWGQAGDDYLDGGKDGFADYLDGGAGRDWFRREMYFNGRIWVQRERMADFTTGTDRQYV